MVEITNITLLALRLYSFQRKIIRVLSLKNYLTLIWPPHSDCSFCSNFEVGHGISYISGSKNYKFFQAINNTGK